MGVSGPPRQGYDGGSSYTIPGSPSPTGGYYGGGGGGAGGLGYPGNPGTNPSLFSNGGPGTPSSITGITTHYAGGGGGGRNDSSGNQVSTAAGGIGGGGSGGRGNNAGVTAATSGVYSTGGGGGGGFASPSGAPLNIFGGHGGSGIVVVRYQIASLTATAKATGGAISFYGGKTIHTFTSSGTFANPAPLTIDYLMVGGGGGASGNNGGG